MALDDARTMRPMGNLGYRPELDGLRGVAILAVVADHAMTGVFPAYRGLGLGSLGGLVGVQLFFVLSGFLITSILRRERDTTGRVSLRAFYMRRLRRLYPTLLVVVVAFVVLSGDVIEAVRAITYTSNVTSGPHGSGWLNHTWSLSVEEQFYLVWPALLVTCRHHATKVAAVGISLTIIAQQVAPWSDSAIYVGLRWDALLAGCLLALRPWRLGPSAFAAGAIVALAFTSGLLGSHELPIYYPVATVAGVFMVAGAGTISALRARWLVHVGRISYALYLTHVMMMRLDLPLLVSLPTAFVGAEILWLLVDRRSQGRRYGTAQTCIVAAPLTGPPIMFDVPEVRRIAHL